MNLEKKLWEHENVQCNDPANNYNISHKLCLLFANNFKQFILFDTFNKSRNYLLLPLQGDENLGVGHGVNTYVGPTVMKLKQIR